MKLSDLKIKTPTELLDLAQSLDPWTRFAVFIIAGFLFLIAIKAYQKAKTKKLKLIMFGFGLFAIKWLIMIGDFYLSPGAFMNSAVTGIFDFFILLFMFWALLKK